MDYYSEHGRDLPWRHQYKGGYDPYRILVSELMLQQTQVNRVESKFVEFMKTFPTVQSLAGANLSDVLVVWSGLGYNRRAKFLHVAAQKIVQDFGGSVPRDLGQLVSLPGVGVNTAGAILAYAYDQQVAFIETNIKTACIHELFSTTAVVSDRDILEIMRRSLPVDSPRIWYWALMDYGSHLKRTVGSHGSRSATYTRQSAFEGSKRQVRGKVLKLLLDGPMSAEDLRSRIDDPRFSDVLLALIEEQFIEHGEYGYRLR